MTSGHSDVSVVEAGPDHAQEIGTFLWELWNEAGPDAPGLTGATVEVIAEIAAPEAIRTRVGGPERRMFLAYRKGTMIGFAATRAVTAEEIELAGIMTLPSAVGGGVGTPLVIAAAASARKHGFKRMTVSTESDNERALRFYQARGFEPTGISTTIVEDTDVVVTNLTLQL